MRSVCVAMVVLASLVLAGCAEDMRVQGSAPATGESFAGLSDPGAFHALGDGALTFASSNGTICKGRPIDPMSGGTTAIACNDGRTGELTFTGSGSKTLTGRGKIGKDDVTMTMSD